MISPVSQIKERLGIEEVVSSYITLDKFGTNFKARCPFHNEKTPSFFVSPDRNGYYCFGCGAKGDIFTFVQEFEGLDFKGALHLLAERAGIQITSFDQKEESEKERLYTVMEEATKFFEKNLNQKAKKYLEDRGLEEKTISDFRIGFAPLDWRELLNFLSKKNFSEKEMEKAGLIKKSEKGFYDRFRGRIMFPLSDSSGRIIAFSGRLLEDDGKSAKYLNSPETPIFSKSKVLYGLNRAKESIRKNNFSILVEGQMDLVLSHQAGFRNTVATSGTALADETVSKENELNNLGLLRRLSGNIILAFDSDKAGANALLRAGKIALGLDMDVKVPSLPDSFDPADIILKNGKESWKELIKNSKHIIIFILESIVAVEKDERKIFKSIREKIFPYIAMLKSAVDKSFFLKRICDFTQIDEIALKEDFKKFEELEENAINSEKEIINNLSKDFVKKDSIERRVLGIIFWQESLKENKIDTDKFLERVSKILNSSKEEIEKNFENEKEDLIFEASVLYQGEKIDKEINELILNLEEENLNEEFEKTMKGLQKAKLENNKELENKILIELNELIKKRESIKSSR